MEGKKAIQTYMTQCASMNRNKVFVMIGNESFTSIGRNFGPFSFAELFYFSHFGRFQHEQPFCGHAKSPQHDLSPDFNKAAPKPFQNIHFVF